MKIYFPQWQGAGIGEGIEAGANAVLRYIGTSNFKQIPLSQITAGAEGEQKYQINNFDAIAEQLGRLKEYLEEHNPENLQTIGGDCGLEIVPVSYLNQKYPKLGVIWFDAHADINRPCDSASCNFHGMPLRTLLGEGEDNMNPLLFSTIAPSQIHYVGLRDIDAAEKKRLEDGNIYHPRKLDIADLVEVLKQKEITHLYLHFDFDCLEPTEYRKTYYQVPDGLFLAEALTCIESLQKEFQVVGTSVLESITTDVKELEPIKPILNALLS